MPASGLADRFDGASKNHAFQKAISGFSGYHAKKPPGKQGALRQSGIVVSRYASSPSIASCALALGSAVNPCSADA